jgi:hypothetical protein
MPFWRNLLTRHIFVPDTQIRPGVPTDHLSWISEYIIEKKYPKIIVGGDWWDFKSLGSHDLPGSLALEGTRVEEDVYVGNEAFKRFSAPFKNEIARQKKNKRKQPWNPECVFLDGNHEHRADRAAANSAKFKGLIGSHLCDTQFFTRYPFLQIATLDGVSYSHYFSNPHSGKPIGGTAQNRITRIGTSFVQGHQQGLDYGTKLMGSGKTLTGVIAGSAYVHIEDYRGNQGQRHFRGIIALNEVHDGEFFPMAVSLDFLCRKYENMSLYSYHKAKYPNLKWEHLL